jgi:metallo-beta-lactamase class B
MKKLTGARMLAEEEEATLLDTGGKTDFLFGSAGWFNPVKVDGTFKDGEKISLGGTDLTAYWMPGHTKGSTSYGLDVTENGKTYHVLIANLGNINEGTVLLHNPKYPNIIQDFERTFRVQKEVPCDVFLSSHAGQFGLLHKWHPGLPYDPDRFVDRDGYLRAVERSEGRFQAQLQQERDEEKAWHDHLQFKDTNPQQ